MSHVAAAAGPEIWRNFLRFFASNREIEGWENTATDWLGALLLIAFGAALLAILLKWLTWKISQTRSTGRRRLTGPGHARIWGFLGFCLTFAAVGVVWAVSRDFRNVIGIPGLFFSWLAGLLLLYPLFFTLFGCFKWEHQWWKIVR
jgi:uncharacterized Tic20 family protein